MHRREDDSIEDVAQRSCSVELVWGLREQKCSGVISMLLGLLDLAIRTTATPPYC